MMTYVSDGSGRHAAGDLVYAINDGGVIKTQVIAAKRDAVGTLAVLTQSLPDPEEEYIPDSGGGRADSARAIGTVRIDTSNGSLVLDGPGGEEITAIAGYLAADNLSANDNWGGDVKNDTKLIGTNATFKEDSLSFTPDTFQGIAIRAVKGVDVRIDGEVVAESVNLIRYTPQRGVFESTSV